MRVLTAEAMRSLDNAACAALTDVELMRRAGRAIASVTRTYHPAGRIVAIAGYGNNGGDAFAAAAELAASHECSVIAFDPGEKRSEARRDAERRAREAGVAIFIAGQNDFTHLITSEAFFLDGFLGVGARARLNDDMRALTRALNEHARGRIIAIDLPSGVDATSGIADDDAIVARATITIGAVKLGLLLEHARSHVGELWFDDIGMEAETFDAFASTDYVGLDENSASALLPHRAPDADKRTAGAPLIIAGSEQFPGAAVLCARAAARAGAGYVTVATPHAATNAIRAHLIEQVVIGFDENDPQHAADAVLNSSKRYGALALGPGIGLSDAVGAMLREIILQSTLPMVIDAGALFHLAKHMHILKGKRVVLTPHAGEFARLSGGGSFTSRERLPRLRAFVREHGVVALLKGQTTLVDDGSQVFVNTTGTAALATAGTGDVLTGMIATLLAQGMIPFNAASLAAYWHGKAGRMAEQRRPIGIVASDVIESIAEAAPRAAHATMPLRVY